jgi:hypothetical protein
MALLAVSHAITYAVARQGQSRCCEFRPTAEPAGESARPPSAIREPFRPDVFLGPLLLVLVSVVIDRTRESHNGEAVTAFVISLGVPVCLHLANRMNYPFVDRFALLIIFGLTYGVAEIYTATGGSYPAVWAWASLIGCLLWGLLNTPFQGIPTPTGFGYRLLNFSLLSMALFAIAPLALAYLLVWNYSIDDIPQLTDKVGAALGAICGAGALWHALVPGKHRLIWLFLLYPGLIASRLLDGWAGKDHHAVGPVLEMTFFWWALAGIVFAVQRIWPGEATNWLGRGPAPAEDSRG